ncbi:MAG TPA: HAD hydrolase-like protein [Candidatus Pacearchaeota archaeon]|nr:HAD family hydrolase [Candidatus Parcubacteria bacterium]HOU46063.1 HAD hydrolase-like protein [Candidatus Pacearchaeota archaeon]HPM08606.1 HAD hydrolase-like protein [Candidatus Pacearchaeota archaeon]HQI74776.1 HAD hydrolase-like protein [Candidatus Pacearchaeota archaeon]
MPRIITVFDFDGVICDSAKKSLCLSEDILMEFFSKYGLTREKAKEIAYNLYYVGGDIPKTMKKEFPIISYDDIRESMSEFDRRSRLEVYQDCGLVDNIRDLIEKIYRSKRCEMYISSLTREKIIKEFLEKHGLIQYFKQIMGQESGLKKNHIKKIRDLYDIEYYDDPQIIFVTDAVADALEDVEHVIGIVTDGNVTRMQSMILAGNKQRSCFVFPSVKRVNDHFESVAFF